MFRLLFAWLVTVALSGAIYYTLYIYSEVVPIMGKQTKKEYNTLITAFSILLSLSVSAFVDRTIRDARWWFLSLRFRPRRTVSKDQASQTKTLLTLMILSRLSSSCRRMGSCPFSCLPSGLKDPLYTPPHCYGSS